MGPHFGVVLVLLLSGAHVNASGCVFPHVVSVFSLGPENIPYAPIWSECSGSFQNVSSTDHQMLQLTSAKLAGVARCPPSEQYFLGKGTFARVFQCSMGEDEEQVAVRYCRKTETDTIDRLATRAIPDSVSRFYGESENRADCGPVGNDLVKDHHYSTY